MGALHYLALRLAIWNSLFLIAFLSIVPLFSPIDISIPTNSNIFAWLNLINTDLFRSYSYFFDNKIFVTLGIGIVSLVNIYYIAKTILYFKYINMPHSLNLLTSNKKYEFDNKTKIVKDYFYKYVGNKIIYKNLQAIDIEVYKNNIDRIRQYLGIQNEIDIEIKPYKQKGVSLELFHIPKIIEKEKISLSKEGFFYFGETKEGSYYIPFNELIHTGIIGITKSGKSTLIKILIEVNLLSKANNDLIEELVLVDLKGTELNKYKNEPKVDFISSFDKLEQKLKALNDLMYDRYQKMQEENLTKLNASYIITIIEEFGSISNVADKKQKEAIFKIIKNICMLGRACNMLIFITSQKVLEEYIPTTILANLPIKILLNSGDNHSITSTIGKLEEIEEIITIHPKDFNKGRFLLSTGSIEGIKLCQCPILIERKT